MLKSKFCNLELTEKIDHIAPDGSIIRLLAQANGGGLCHCTLPSGKTSAAVKHKTVEEIWFILEGNGEMWQKEEHDSIPFQLFPGLSFNIPVDNSFQFKNLGDDDLKILICTLPPWPGADDAVAVEGHWKL